MAVTVALVQHQHHQYSAVIGKVESAVEKNTSLFNTDERGVYVVSLVEYEKGLAIMQGNINNTVDLETGERVFIHPEHEDSGEFFRN